MSIDSNDAQELVSMLSQERLTAILAISTSSIEAIKLHQETLKLGASLMVVIATIEIVLRNSVCKQLDAHFGVPNWLQQPPVPFRWREPEHKNVAKANDAARRSEYSKLTQQQKHLLDTIAYPSGRPQNKSHLDRAKDRRKNIEVSNGKVIAELTFYFWKRLFGPEY